MSTRKQLREVSAIRQAECWRVVPQNQSLTTRMFAGIIAVALVLPAMGAVIDAARVGSPTLLLLGFVFLIGFGVPYYIFLHWALEEDIASETESGQTLPTRIIDETPDVVRQMAPREMAYSLPREPNGRGLSAHDIEAISVVVGDRCPEEGVSRQV
jgi:hypothetical protein